MQIDYPSEWTKEEMENGVEFYPPDVPLLTAFSLRTTSAGFATSEDYLKELVNNDRVFDNFQTLEIESTSLGGEAAHRAITSWELPSAEDESSYKNLYVVSVVDNNAYFISFVAPASEFDSLLPTIEQMIDSFEFVGFTN
jgi:hypothetical protein